MKGAIITAALTALLTAGPAAAVYKCDINGETVFSQTPCAADAEKVEVKVHRPSEEEAKAAEERASWASGENAAMRAERKSREAGIEIKKLETAIEVYQRDMDRELAALRDQKASASNNLAGATWEQSIATEMQAVVEKYNTKIKLAKDRIAVLREQRTQ
jgi:predicted RNase H-like nuclease (RuvC/YqgF family)